MHTVGGVETRFDGGSTGVIVISNDFIADYATKSTFAGALSSLFGHEYGHSRTISLVNENWTRSKNATSISEVARNYHLNEGGAMFEQALVNGSFPAGTSIDLMVARNLAQQYEAEVRSIMYDDLMNGFDNNDPSLVTQASTPMVTGKLLALDAAYQKYLNLFADQHQLVYGGKAGEIGYRISVDRARLDESKPALTPGAPPALTLDSSGDFAVSYDLSIPNMIWTIHGMIPLMTSDIYTVVGGMIAEQVAKTPEVTPENVSFQVILIEGGWVARVKAKDPYPASPAFDMIRRYDPAYSSQQGLSDFLAYVEKTSIINRAREVTEEQSMPIGPIGIDIEMDSGLGGGDVAFSDFTQVDAMTCSLVDALAIGLGIQGSTAANIRELQFAQHPALVANVLS